MTSYVRPPIDALVFHDAEGSVIDFGHRWGGPPPEDTYSVDTHPERFAPLHVIADALITYLRDSYDVTVDEALETAADLLHPATDVVRALRIRPNDVSCAALTFVFTAYPGIFVHAGLLHDFPYPVCGCDACDSEWAGEAEDLEQQVLAVVDGRYRESIERGPSPWVEYTTTYEGGFRSGRSPASGLPADRVKAATPILRRLGDAWRAWPPRASAD